MYKEKMLITSIDVDDHLCLKVSSIFKFFQQVSTNHCEKLNIGQKDTIDKGVCWVVTKMQFVIHKYPKMNDEVIVTTHPGVTNKFLFPRFYEMYDKKGNLLISGSSIWVLIDMNTRHVVLKPDLGKNIPGEKNKDDIEIPESITVQDELVKVEDRKVRYNDIDLNGHLNNTKYVDYIIDLNDREFYSQKMVKEIIINYDKEIRDGNVVSLLVNKDRSIVRGEVEGKTSFTALLIYGDR